MTKINILTEQIHLAKKKTDQLISDIPAEQWLTIPDILLTNLNWQIGHIILANYLHGVASISGASEAFRSKVNVPDFIKHYGPKSKPTDFKDEKLSKESLLEIYEFIYTLIENGLENMADNDLDDKTAIPNPAVQTKYQALMLLSQHQSWHNGQIAILKRVLSQ